MEFSNISAKHMRLCKISIMVSALGLANTASAFVVDGDLSDLINGNAVHVVDSQNDAGSSGRFISFGFEITDGYFTYDDTVNTFYLGMKLLGPVGLGEGSSVPYIDTLNIDPFFEQYSVDLDLTGNGDSEIQLLLKSFQFGSPATPADLSVNKNNSGFAITPDVSWVSGRNTMEFSIQLDSSFQGDWSAALKAGNGGPPEDSVIGTVSAVPLPASAYLFFSGIVGLNGLRRTRV